MAAIFADEIFKHIFLNENVFILIQISLNFVPKVQHRFGIKVLSEPINQEPWPVKFYEFTNDIWPYVAV